MRKCYLAGPMRSKPNYNYPAFTEGARKLRDAGWEVFNPAEMDIEEDKVDYSALNMSTEEQIDAATAASCRKFARRDLICIIDNLKAENGDAIVLLPDWDESEGAIAELGVSQWVKLENLTLEEALG